MKLPLVIACLLAASPAFGQTKVYTNADLGRPLSPNRGSVTPEVLAALAAHQFRVPMTFDGPRVVSSGLSPTSGPFGDFQNAIVPRRLDGSLWSEPQWQVSYYPGFYTPYVPYAPYAGRSPARHPTAEHRRSAFRPGRR